MRPEERFLGTVRAPERARLQAAGGDVFAYEFGERDEAWIVAHRLEFREEGES